MDRMTQEQRSRCMAAIRSRDTKPEILVRRYLFAHGYRYRLNCAGLPGHPDIVMRKHRTVIFVNGCFWHGHEGCRYFVMPKSRIDFWQAKIERNIARDREERLKLADMGWHCLTVWECQLKPKAREQTLQALDADLARIFAQDHSPKQYLLPDEAPAMVADTEDGK